MGMIMARLMPRMEKSRKGIGCLPRALIVKEPIRSLLIVFSNCFRFFVALEPGLILLVKPPALRFQCFCCKVLLVCTLAVIEGIEESVGLDTGVQARVVKNRQRLLRVVRRRKRIRILWA